MEEHEVYAVTGEEGFRALVQAFYKRVPNDPVLGPMYRGRDLAGAEDRLRSFLIYRFGGPQSYLAERGHPRLRMRHAPFTVGQAARDHWIEIMSEALAETDISPEAKAVLNEFFHSTADFLINSPS